MTHQMHKLQRRCQRILLGDSRGLIMHYTAIAACLILAFFSLSYDVAKISEQKMGMQNAADSAALEMATWQARGLNSVQNINDEIYELDKAIMTAYYASATLVILSEGLRFVPYVGMFLYYTTQAAAAGAAGCGVYAHIVLAPSLCWIREGYVYGSFPIGYSSANSMAGKNGAEPVLSIIQEQLEQMDSTGTGISGKISSATDLRAASEFSNFTGFPLVDNVASLFTEGPRAVGLPVVVSGEQGFPGMWTLGLKKIASKDSTDYPLSTKGNWYARAAITVINERLIFGGSYVTIEKSLWPNDWVFGHPSSYYESGKPYDTLHLPPMIWFAGSQVRDQGMLSRYFLGDTYIPLVWTYAVGQACGENVVCHRENNLHGVKANAYLISFPDALKYAGEAKKQSTDSSGISMFLEKLPKVFLH